MKKILAILCSLVSLPAFAQMNLSLSKQLEIVEEVAKSERKYLWRSGHTDVSSFVSKITKAELNVKIKDNPHTYNSLDKTEVSKLYSCINRPRECSLFLIDIVSSHMGGSGVINVYVLLNPTTARFYKIKHIVHAE